MAYIQGTIDIVQPIVCYKLLCNPRYDPTDKNQLLTVLANRIALEPCLQNSEAVGLVNEAVRSHLRWIAVFDQKGGFVQTTSQSEPVLVEAAALLLMEAGAKDNVWEATITWLFWNLMTPGFIDPGRTGELVCRLLCFLARDMVLHKTTNVPPTRLKYAQAYGVVDFLERLLRQCDELLDSPAMSRSRCATTSSRFASCSRRQA